MTPFEGHAIVELGGRRYDSWREDQLFERVEVELTTEEASQVEWRVFDPDPDYAFVERLTSADGIAEQTIEVWLGFGPDPDLGDRLFKGIVARVEHQQGTTTVRAYDMSYKMRKVQKTEYHKGLDDLGVIRRLAERNGLQFEGPEAAITLDRHKSLKQEGVTDWALARQCAEDAGLVLYTRGDTLYAKEAAKTGEPVLTLRYREDFLLLEDFGFTFRLPENQEGRPAKVETRGRGRGGRRLKGESEGHERGGKVVEVKRDLRVKSKRHADRRAEAKKALQREHAFEAHVEVLPGFMGRRVDVRDTVRLEKVPRLFVGNYIADSALHTFEPGELSMSLDLYRDIKV